MNEKVFIGEDVLFENVFDDATHSIGYYEKELKILELKSKEQDIDMRKDFATKTYNLVCIYLVVVFFVVFLVCCPAEFNMSDGVLITLLGTTTINVIGLFAIVMNYLFPKK